MFMIGETVNVQEGGAGVVLARHVDLKDGTIVFLAAKEISGEARVMIDVKAAAVIAVVLGLFLVGLRILLGRSR